MNLPQSIRNLVLRYQPLRVAVKSLRNLFFPTTPIIDPLRTIAIEMSSVCDARCIFCNYRFEYRAKVLVSAKVFEERARSSVAAGYRHLDLTSLGGEIFTHKEAVRLIEIAKEAGFQSISTFTNAIQLYRYDVDRLLNSGLDFIFISTPGFSEDLYRTIFGVEKFADFAKSVLLLLDAHDRLKSTVQIYFEPRTSATKRELMESDFWTSLRSRYRNPAIHMSEPLRIFDTWGGDVKQKDLLPGMKIDWNPLKSIYPIKEVYPCERLYTLGILANGDVRMCNCRYDSSIETEKDSLFIASINHYATLGQLLEEHGQKIKRVVEGFIGGHLPALCRKCPFYIPVRKIPSDKYPPMKSENDRGSN